MLTLIGRTSQLSTITDYLSTTKHHLGHDISRYAFNRQRYWLNNEWDLKDRCFKPAVKDERLWNYCKHWMPDADLGLVVYGSVGITPHRDDSYADYRAVGINLGQVKSWYYDCQYPKFHWTKDTNPSNPKYYDLEVGGVYEFNCKNPHAAIEPAADRWAIFLWRVCNKYREQFLAQTS